MSRKVVVEGGGANLYEISEYGGRFTACHVRVKFLADDRIPIGSARSLEDTITLIRQHSGRRIKSID